jgi:RNA polymerase sigma factor (sigma-70 family)
VDPSGDHARDGRYRPDGPPAGSCRAGAENAFFADLLSDSSASPEAHAVAGSTRQHVRRLLDSLTERERTVLQLRFGFATGREHSLQETADRIGLSRERVRQIERIALARLRRRGSQLPTRLKAA